MHLLLSRLTRLNQISSLALCTSLCACGAGSAPSASGNHNTPAPIATSAFVELAQTASCNNLKNRMFVIDQKFVFWDKAGSCSDSAYAQTLYGNTAQTTLCTNADSIAGPRFNCADKENESLFKTILQNLEKADLGLGKAHQVQALTIAAGKESVLPMLALNSSFYRNAAPANMVIRDISAWTQFWNQANIQPDTIDQRPDFLSSMVVASFFKTANNCSSTQILRLASDGQKLSVEFAQDEKISVASCDPKYSGISTPMNLIKTRRLDLPVDFIDVSKLRVAHELLATGQDSRIQQQRQLVIRDQQTWGSLWNEHTPMNAPAIDFSKQMVVALFLGQRANACFAIDDVAIWRSNGVTRVSHHDSSPAPGTICAMAISSPYMFLTIPRNDDQFEFNSVQIQI
ncbi:MAG: hypothetical protein HY253_05920 [Burkholderiales bacterium]|nr:hypothetical protein [Burkholderiales bacterium]